MDNEQLLQLIKEELKGNQQAIQEIKTEMKAMDTRLSAKIDAMGTEMKAMDSKFDAKIDAMDSKFDAKFDTMDAKIDAMDSKFDAKFDTMDAKIDAMDSRLNAKIDASATQQADFLKQQTEAIMTMTEDRIRGLEVLIENDIGKRIDTLCDGYKLNHEKQWDLEKRVAIVEYKLGIA